MSWASVVPKELSISPLPLVVLTGLDIKHNAIHKEIWDGFNLRSNQKFRYKLLDGDHEYPKCKNKRPTEFYVPKGILKTNWFNKHLYLVPSLVVVFFDLDWDEPNWKEKQMECSTKMELVRHSLLDRNTRIILILIQKHPSIPIDGDNILARERYPALCTACSIKNNYLFLLHAEHLLGYINKLEEDAFTEPTQTYYTLEIKAIKFKRDSLIKVTHQYLFVRLAIKIAFFNEMKSDVYKAIEYYKQAYLSVLDIRFYDTNILEIKTVASIINYKLIAMLFEIKHPIDAIDQFRKHIDIFRIKIGSPELSFEHSAWLSKQFELMGELFEDAIRKGLLSAVQTQHPGFYFHSAANHATQRRINCKDFANKNYFNKQWTPENPSPIELLNNLEFYGQRPWRQGQQGMEILDQQKERDGIICLQELELKENLTPLITGLFKKAITNFKEFNCKRMKQYLSVCMAEEYYLAKDYQEALNIYVNVLNDYNNEHWWPILTSLLSNALKCAYLVGDITNYCLLSIEIIGKNILLAPNEKSQVQSNLMRVLSNQIPLFENDQFDMTDQSTKNALLRWQEELDKSQATSSSSANSTQSLDTSIILATHKIIPAHVNGMVPFVECKVQFASSLFNSNQKIELFVYLRTDCIDPIQFNKLYVRFNLPHYNQFCIVENSESLFFAPNKIYKLKFSFLSQKQDIGKDIEVSSISLELGNRDARVLILRWKGDCKNALTHENQTIMSFARLNSNLNDSIDLSTVDWNSINVVPYTNIVARKPNIDLKLEHKMPIFVDEYYAIKVTIENKEDSSIENISLSTEFQPVTTSNDLDPPLQLDDSKTIRLWVGTVDKNKFSTQEIKTYERIETKKTLTEFIYVQMKEIKSVNIIIKVKYDVDVLISEVSSKSETPKQASPFENDGIEFDKDLNQKIKCTCIQEDQQTLESINPFKIEFNMLSMQMKPLNNVREGEPFLLLCEIKNQSPYSLKFKNSFINTANYVRFKTNKEIQQSFLKGETLKPSETATECFCLLVDLSENSNSSNDNSLEKTSAKIPNLGEYLIEWKRKNLLSSNNIEPKETSEDDDTEDENESDSIDTDPIKISEDCFNVKTKITLPEITSEPFPFLVEAITPTSGSLTESLTIVYKIFNKTKTYLDIECSLEQNEFFALAGKKMELIQILPNDFYSYQYIAQPLQAGYCKLPNFHIKLNNCKLDSTTTNVTTTKSTSANISFDSNNSLDPILKNMLPSQIFVFPEKIESLIITS